MNNKKTIYGIIFILICLVGIDYAALVSNITITGTAKIKANTFDVHFENITLTNGSVEINKITENAGTYKVNYTVSFKYKGTSIKKTILQTVTVQ